MTHDSGRERWEVAHRLRTKVIGQALAMGLSREEAEDVASEAVLRIGGKVDLDPVRAAGWARVVGHNLIMDTLRSRPSCDFLVRLMNAQVVPVIPQDVVDDRLEAVWATQQFVQRLPARQREALYKLAEASSVEAVAVAMGESYKAVESLVSRGRSTVRNGLRAAMSGFVGFAIAIRGGARHARPLASGLVIPLSVTAAFLSVGVNATPGVDLHHPANGILRSGWAPALTSTSRLGTATRNRTLLPSSQSPEGAGKTASVVGAGKVGPVQHKGISMTRTHPDETLPESIVRCLSHPIAISPSAIGCQ